MAPTLGATVLGYKLALTPALVKPACSFSEVSNTNMTTAQTLSLSFTSGFCYYGGYAHLLYTVCEKNSKTVKLFQTISSYSSWILDALEYDATYFKNLKELMIMLSRLNITVTIKEDISLVDTQ